MIGVAALILFNAMAKESFVTPPIESTNGALAVPPRSPANCILPFILFVASTIVADEVPDPTPVPPLLATYL